MGTILVQGLSLSLAHIVRPLEIAKVLRRKGYNLIFSGDSKYLQIVERAGFEVRYLPDFNLQRMITLIGKDPREIHQAEVAQEWVEAELDLLEEIKPLGVIDDFRITAGISTEIMNMPRFSILNGHVTPYAVTTLLDDSLPGPLSAFGFGTEEAYNQVRQGYGLEPVNHPLELVTGNLVMICDIPEYCPMKPDMPDHYHFIGPLTWSNQLPTPPWVNSLDPNRPKVYVTMGSTGLKEIFQAAIEAFRGTEYQVMMTLGNIVQVEDLQPLPDNFYWSQLVDGYALASLADVVFCHAGNGTSYQALQAGTPLVTLPLARDQHWNAHRQAELGVSVVVSAPDPDSIRAGVEEVLSNPSYKQAASRIQGKIKKYDAPHLGAQMIHEYIQEKVYA